MANGNKSLLLPIVIVIVVIVVIIIAMFLLWQKLPLFQQATPKAILNVSPSPTIVPTLFDPTAAWPIYQSNAYGFSIKYPDSFKLSPNLYPKSFATFVLNNEEYAPPENIPTYILYIKRISKPLSGQIFEKFLLNYVTLDPSGKHPQSFSDFTPIVIGNNQFYFIKTGLFEGQLSLSYFLPLSTGMFSFNLISTKVDWTNSNFDIQQDPGHIFLKQMFSTFNLISLAPTSSPTDQNTALGCVASGGTVKTVDCYCTSTQDFYNNCLIGACSCPPNPAFLKQVKNCVCPQGKCFDGNQCANTPY